MMDNVEKEFRKVFGDMYLSESETALRIFEYGYKAGMEKAAKICDEITTKNDIDDVLASWCSAAIREKMK